MDIDKSLTEKAVTLEELDKMMYDYTIVFCGISNMYDGCIYFNCYQKHATGPKEEIKTVYVKIKKSIYIKWLESALQEALDQIQDLYNSEGTHSR